MRWEVFQTPRARSVGWAIAIGLLTLTAIGWGVALVSATDWFGRSFAIDYGIYMGALDRFQAGDGWYQARQLHGPYPIELGDVLYPPVLMYLLFPFRYLGPWLWTIIPAAILAAVVWRHRPGPWTWVAIALCLAWPYSPAKFVFGNPVIWATAAVALGTIWWWPAAFAVLKPTIIPFALIGFRDRRWWFVIVGLAIASLPSLADTLHSPQVLLDAQPNPVDGRGGPFYSITEFPLLAIPIVAWLGARLGARSTATADEGSPTTASSEPAAPRATLPG
jgi:hypothetical protein